MSDDHETYPVRADAHTLIVTPNGEDPHYVLDYTAQGDPYVGFAFTDPEAGSTMLALSVTAVPLVIRGLQSVLDNLEQCRAEWHQRNGEPQ
jgi:hypothetical protein